MIYTGSKTIVSTTAGVKRLFSECLSLLSTLCFRLERQNINFPTLKEITGDLQLYGVIRNIAEQE